MSVKDWIILTLLVIVFALGFASWDSFTSGEKVARDTVETETIKWDTIYSEPDTIVIDSIVVKEPIESYTNSEGDTVNLYVDRVEVDSSLTIQYSAEVIGVLNDINFGVYRKDQPQILKTVFRDRTITETVTKYPSGIYAGLEAGVRDGNAVVGVGASYIKGKHNVSLFLGSDRSVRVGYQIKIF